HLVGAQFAILGDGRRNLGGGGQGRSPAGTTGERVVAGDGRAGLGDRRWRSRGHVYLADDARGALPARVRPLSTYGMNQTSRPRSRRRADEAVGVRGDSPQGGGSVTTDEDGRLG